MSHTIYEYVIRFFFSVLVIALLGFSLLKIGMFDLARFLPSHCRLETPFACDNLELTRTNASFELRNGLDQDVNVTYLSVHGCKDVRSFVVPRWSEKQLNFGECSFNGHVETGVVLDYTLDNRLFHTLSGSLRGYAR